MQPLFRKCVPIPPARLPTDTAIDSLWLLRLLSPKSSFLADRGFTATQLVATLTCSIAAAMIALAAFRPAVARCAAAKPLVTASGWVMIAYAIFQLKAATLAYFLLEEFDSQGEGVEMNNVTLYVLIMNTQRTVRSTHFTDITATRVMPMIACVRDFFLFSNNGDLERDQTPVA